VIRIRYQLGAGTRQIAAACNFGRTTVSEHVGRAEAAMLSWPSAGELSDEDISRQKIRSREDHPLSDISEAMPLDKRKQPKGI